MGQATLDLPDPAQQSAAPISSADDLLSQLAGQEIDRLLADADQNAAPPEPEADSSAAEPASTQDDIEHLEKLLTPEKLDEVAAEVAQAAPTPVAASELPSAPAQTELPSPATSQAYAEQVGKLLDELNTIPDKPAAEEAPEPSSKSAIAAPAVTEDATTAAERAALAPATDEIDEPATVQQVLDQITGPSQVPFYVRGLELLNLPFSFCPDEIRDTLGKVAILTMMNSIGVLLYVLLFRKH